MNPSVILTAGLLATASWGGSLGERGEVASAPAKARLSLQERIALQFAAASSPANPGDARARDLAAARLASCEDFLSAVGERLLWGGCEPVTLERNDMPPEDSSGHAPAGIRDETRRAELVRLARESVSHADAAFAFESSRAAGQRQASCP